MIFIFNDLVKTMTNPFENPDGQFVVLQNDEGQFSLWPTFREAPAGWTIVGPKGKREECLKWIDETWTDMRPRSLVEKMSGAALPDDKTWIN